MDDSLYAVLKVHKIIHRLQTLAIRSVFYDIGNFVSYIIKRSAGCTRCAQEGYKSSHTSAHKVCVAYAIAPVGAKWASTGCQRPSRLRERGS